MKIKGYIIYQMNDTRSQAMMNRCLRSIIHTKSDETVSHLIVNGFTPECEEVKEASTRWSWWPDSNVTVNKDFGIMDDQSRMHNEPAVIHMTSYGDKYSIPLPRLACSLSHIHLWKMIRDSGEPGLIMEHDTVFIKKFEYTEELFKEVMFSGVGVFSINAPVEVVDVLKGAKSLAVTRKGAMYHKYLYREKKKNPDRTLFEVPGQKELGDPVTKIQNYYRPYGLPGNSAYVLMPDFAQKLVDKVEKIGIWPNDALICKNIFGSWVRASSEYYTVPRSDTSFTKS